MKDIYSILKSDHERLMENLNELISLKQDDDYRMILIEEITNELVPHSRAEEAVFYNSIRAVSDTPKVMHSYKEHLEAETLLRTLQVKDKVDFDWKSTAIKLRDALEHHINEEESEIFAEAEKIFSHEEAQMMGDAFTALKDKVSREGFMKTSFDMVVNLMPPGFVDKIRGLKDSNLKGDIK